MIRTSPFAPCDEPPTPLGAASSVDHWLNILSRLLHLPEATRQAVCSELREHLHERSRDLMLAGTDEDEAVRIAITELGETASLARKLEQANRPPTRRLLMNLSMIGFGAGIVALTVLTVSPRSTPPAAVFNQSPDAATPDVLKTRKLPLSLKAGGFEEAVTFLAKSADLPVHFRWPQLNAVGVNQDTPVTLTTGPLPLAKGLDLLVQSVSPEIETIAWRFDDGVIEVGTRHQFDQQDTVLVSYDLTDVIDSIVDKYNKPYDQAVRDITGVIIAVVEPEGWRENGGDLGCIQSVGGTMFIKAPKRMQAGAEWIMQQLRASVAPEKHAAAADVNNPRLLSDLPLLTERITRQPESPAPTQVPTSTKANAQPAIPAAAEARP